MNDDIDLLKKALSRKHPCDESHKALARIEDNYEKLYSLYIKLTNCDQYGEDKEVHGYYCPISLLDEFDELVSPPLI